MVLYLTWYLLYAAYLAVFSGEGALPPTWRDPDVPAGAEVVSIDEGLCGSGGCARSIEIAPAEGQGAEDLAREMGLRAGMERTYGWRPTNPSSVVVYLPNGYGGRGRADGRGEVREPLRPLSAARGNDTTAHAVGSALQTGGSLITGVDGHWTKKGL